MRAEIYWKIYRVTDTGKVFKSNGRECSYYTFGTQKYKLVQLKHPFDKRWRHMSLHRIIANLFVHNPAPKIFNCVDHIDGNKENNHHTNLRWLNHHLNCIWRTKAKGYSYERRWKKYRAKCCGKLLGFYKTEAEAHYVYKKYQKEHFEDTYKKYIDAEESSSSNDS